MPALYSWRRAATLTFLALPLGFRSERAYQAMPRLARSLGGTGNHTVHNGLLPMLSIIVPARNEAKNLARLLPVLAALRYPGLYEVIVVDDNSTDETARVAAEHGARVIRLQGLPRGWLGKPHACHEGAMAAWGEWLLFTDADTVHAVDGPARAVAHAVQVGLDGLSLWLGQECRNWIDRLALTAAFAGLFAGLPRENSMLNGQYILLRRDVYEGSGGFAAVRDEMLEDVALGHCLRERGYKVPMMRGGDAAEARMYESTSHMWHGMTRLGAGSIRWTGAGAVGTALFITAVMSPLVVLVGVLRGRLDRKWLPATYGAAVLSMITWAQRFGSAGWALLAPVGALLVQVAAVWGLANRLLGRGVRWKGRTV